MTFANAYPDRVPTPLCVLASEEMTFPWDVPPETIVVEFVDGRWRVVPHRLRVEIFATREEAMARALAIAHRFLSAWKIVERPTRASRKIA